MDVEKNCRKCGEAKPLDDFYRSKSAKDGRRSECKKCAVAAARQWNIENKERFLENQSRYSTSEKGKATRKEHRGGPARERILEQKRESHARNRETNNAKCREWWSENRDTANAERLSRYMSDPEYREHVKAQGRAWREANREHLRNKMLVRNFGIDLEQFRSMLDAQGGRCAICSADITGTEPLGNRDRVKAHVDHCHDTGRVRALLCTGCNKALGHFRDDPARMRAAADYVERYLTI